MEHLLSCWSNGVFEPPFRQAGQRGLIVSIAKRRSDIKALEEAGVDSAFHVFAEAGIGLAESACQQLS